MRQLRELYRIIDAAECVDPATFRLHHVPTAERIARRLREAAERGEVRGDVEEVHAWAVMGMNVSLGLRFGVGDEDRTLDEVAGVVADVLRERLAS